MKFQILSDLHLEFHKKLPKNICNDHYPKAPILFLVGDIGYPTDKLWLEFIEWCETKFNRIYYVQGNHESYTKDIDETTNNIKSVFRLKPKFTLLERGVISYVDGNKIIGCTLWSKQRPYIYVTTNDYKYIFKNDSQLSFEALTDMHEQDKLWLDENIDSNTIVVTHHLPSFDLIHENFKTESSKKYNEVYASNCDELILRSKLWIYGHTHIGSDIVFKDKVRCICNPYGYPDETHRHFTNNAYEI